MNEKQILRAAIKRQGMTQPEVSAKVGLASKTVGAMMCRPNDLALGNFYKLLSALGYEIVIRSKNNSDKVEFVLSDDDTPIETERYVSPEEAAKLEAIKADNAAAIKGRLYGK